MAPAPRIIIDAGHGGSERAGNSSAYGARGVAGVVEKDVTLDIAKHVIARLGGVAALTRTGDKNMTIGARAARGQRSDVFVSIHANYGAPDLSGPEVYVHPEAGRGSRLLAGQIARALDRQAGRFGGGADERRGAMAILNPTAIGDRTAACLVEVDYLSNPNGERRLGDPRERAAIGAAIAGAIQQHLAAGNYGQQDLLSSNRGQLDSGSLTLQPGIAGNVSLLLTNAHNGGTVTLEGTVTWSEGAGRPRSITARFVDLASQGIAATEQAVRPPSESGVAFALTGANNEALRWPVPMNAGPARIELLMDSNDPQTRVTVQWRTVHAPPQLVPPAPIPLTPQPIPLGYGQQNASQNSRLVLRGRTHGSVLINVPHQQPPDNRTLTFSGVAEIRAGRALRLGASLEDPSARPAIPHVRYVDLDPYNRTSFSFDWPCQNLLTPGVYDVVLRIDGAQDATEVEINHGYFIG